MIGGLGAPEIVVIGSIVVILFGAKKIPELARGIGQGIRIFKKETSDEQNNNQPKKEE